MNSSTPKKDKHNLSAVDLQSMLDSLKGKPVKNIKLSPLAGDASTRRYYRIFFQELEGSEETLVVMQLESPKQGKETDYGKLTRFLNELGVPVPILYAYDDTRGILLGEDCGDLLFHSIVESCKSESEVQKWYEKAINLIVRFQAPSPLVCMLQI